MSIFDRRPPLVTRPQTRRYGCEHCAWYSYSADETLGHMFTTHLNRRVLTVAPHPGRRHGDAVSPWAQLRQAAADRGEGLSRPERRRLS